jgi:hypothetical protein
VPSAAAPSLVARTRATLMASPLHFLLLQIPQSLSDVTDNLFPSYFEHHRAVAFSIMLPLWVVTSALSSGLTFSSTRRWHREHRLSARDAWTTVAGKLWPLIAAYLLAGIVVALGFLSFILPGFYYMALYLFVPLVVVDEPRLPWSVYLLRSKKIAKRSMRRTLVLAMSLLFVGLALSVLDGVVKDGVEHMISNYALRAVVFLSATLCISLVTGAIINVGISEFFLNLKKARPNEKPAA